MSTFETLHKKMRVKDSIIAKQSQDLAALQAQLDEARRDLGDLQGGHELTVQELHAVGRERDEAREWCQRLQRDTQTLTCIYCGKEYPPGSPTHGAAVLTEHIRVCEKHPMRALEADLVAARAEIVTLRTTLTNVRGENPTYFKHDEFGNQVPAGNMASRRQDEIDEALVRTAKDYEGLRVVNPDQLLQELVVALYNSGRDQSGAPCISVIWDGCSGEARDKDALRLVIAPVIGSKNSYYSNAYFAAQSAKLSEAETALADARQWIDSEPEWKAAFLTNRDEIIKAFRDYLAFLDKANEGPILNAAVHSWKCPQSDIEEGKRHRAIIAALTQESDAAIAKGGSATTEPIGSPEHCERMAKFLADHKDPELWGAVGALNWAAKHIRELTS